MSKKAFVREATGLVREISFLDHVVTNMNGVVPLAAMVLTPWWIWFAVPGGDPILATVAGFLFGALGYLISYAMISATFPRSAAPYLANSRVLHPAIGWPGEALMWLGWIMALALYPSFMITWALIPGLYTMGVSTGNPGLIDAAAALTNPYNAVLLGIVFFLFSLLIAIAGTRRLVRTFQLPITIIMVIAVLVIIGVWVTASPAQLDAVLPKYLGKDSSSIMTEAKSSFPDAMIPVTYAFVPTMASIAFTAGSFNTYWNSWASGEVRRASDVKMQIMSMVIPSAFITIIVLVVLGAALGTVGREFLLSMTQILTLNPSFFSAAPGMAGFSTMTLIPMMLVDNPIAQFVIMIGMIAAVLAYLPATWLILSREWFAWSFDRLVPAKFSEVSDRFHTPIYSLVFNAIVGFIFLILFTFFIQYLGFFTTAAWDTTLVTVALLCLSAALLPARKTLWDQSPVKKYKIAGVPAITIAGLLGFFYNGSAVLFFSITPALGFGLPSTLLLVTVFVIPFILYWVVRAIRKSQGIDIDAVFRMIPPE